MAIDFRRPGFIIIYTLVALTALVFIGFFQEKETRLALRTRACQEAESFVADFLEKHAPPIAELLDTESDSEISMVCSAINFRFQEQKVQIALGNVHGVPLCGAQMESLALLPNTRTCLGDDQGIFVQREVLSRDDHIVGTIYATLPWNSEGFWTFLRERSNENLTWSLGVVSISLLVYFLLWPKAPPPINNPVQAEVSAESNHLAVIPHKINPASAPSSDALVMQMGRILAEALKASQSTDAKPLQALMAQQEEILFWAYPQKDAKTTPSLFAAFEALSQVNSYRLRTNLLQFECDFSLILDPRVLHHILTFMWTISAEESDPTSSIHIALTRILDTQTLRISFAVECLNGISECKKSGSFLLRKTSFRHYITSQIEGVLHSFGGKLSQRPLYEGLALELQFPYASAFALPIDWRTRMTSGTPLRTENHNATQPLDSAPKPSLQAQRKLGIYIDDCEMTCRAWQRKPDPHVEKMTFSSPQEFLTWWNSNSHEHARVSWIVTDQHFGIGEISGLDLAFELKEKHKNICPIFLSSNGFFPESQWKLAVKKVIPKRPHLTTELLGHLDNTTFKGFPYEI